MMMRLFIHVLVFLFLAMPVAVLAAKPIVTDSRIRTYVYNENEVFKLTTEFGYQSNIVFSADEKIETLSAGDISGFKLTPSGNRIFIRALKSDFHTNMTVVTNERVYQFELSSFVEQHEDIIYVLRFYYPEEDIDVETGAPLDVAQYLRPSPPDFGVKYSPQQGARGMVPSILPSPNMPPVSSPYLPAATAHAAAQNAAGHGTAFGDYQAWKQNMNGAQAAAASGRNYDYTMQGSDTLSPWQIFDEQGRTYVRYSQEVQRVPDFYILRQNGLKIPLQIRFEDGYVVFDGVYPRFFIERDGETLAVFNEQQLALGNGS